MRRLNKRTIVNIVLALFFVLCVFAPIFSMLARITPEGLKQVITSSQFSTAMKNSLSTGIIATIISLILSLAAASCIERTDIKFKSVLRMLFVIPMLIPSISHAFGIVSLFGKNGMITNILGININIYGFWGIVVGSVMYSFPVAFLMFSSTLQYEDGITYNVADVLGVPWYNQFIDITLPFLKKTMISAFFAVFTMIVTDYGVPLMIGGKTTTLSVMMYNKAVAMIDYGSGSVIGAVLLIPAIIAFLVDYMNPDNSQGSFVAERVNPKKNHIRNAFAYAYSVLLCLFIIAPIFAFASMTFETKYPIDTTFTLHHIVKTMNAGAGEYLFNSLLYAVLVSIIGTVVAFLCAYFTSRIPGKYSRALHLLSITSMAIPGIVLGLSYVIFFHSSFIYGTILIVVLVNSVHFFSSPYLMMYNTLSKVNHNLEDVGHTLGISRFNIIKDVIIPKVKYTIFEMLVYFFVNSMMTISAVSFLAPPAAKPVALMINQFEAQRLMESAAFISLLILVINMIAKLILAKFQSKESAA